DARGDGADDGLHAVLGDHAGGEVHALRGVTLVVAGDGLNGPVPRLVPGLLQREVEALLAGLAEGLDVARQRRDQADLDHLVTGAGPGARRTRRGSRRAARSLRAPASREHK